LHVLAETTRAFVATLAAQERLSLTNELEHIAQDAVRSVKERVQEGAASPVERARLEVALSSARLERTRVEHELAASRHALASSWGEAKPSFTSVEGNLDELLPPPPLAELESSMAGTPELARWSSELDRRKATLALERARGVPNPTLRVGGRRFEDNGDTALVFEVSLPLPIFDRNQGTVLAARRDIAKAKAEKVSAELTSRTELARRYEDLLSAYQQAKLLHEEVLPDAQAAYESARSGYRQGRLLQLDVLDAHRTWFELRAREVDVLASYHLARADVDEMSGRLLAGSPAAEDVR
jgi:cobalt-zinc-cadmium efflux system outer membrane protein